MQDVTKQAADHSSNLLGMIPLLSFIKSMKDGDDAVGTVGRVALDAKGNMLGAAGGGTIGAILGGGLGHALGDKDTGAANGALAGTALGALIGAGAGGYYADKKVDELQDSRDINKAKREAEAADNVKKASYAGLVKFALTREQAEQLRRQRRQANLEGRARNRAAYGQSGHAQRYGLVPAGQQQTSALAMAPQHNMTNALTMSPQGGQLAISGSQGALGPANSAVTGMSAKPPMRYAGGSYIRDAAQAARGPRILEAEIVPNKPAALPAPQAPVKPAAPQAPAKPAAPAARPVSPRQVRPTRAPRLRGKAGLIGGLLTAAGLGAGAYAMSKIPAGSAGQPGGGTVTPNGPAPEPQPKDLDLTSADAYNKALNEGRKSDAHMIQRMNTPQQKDLTGIEALRAAGAMPDQVRGPQNSGNPFTGESGLTPGLNSGVTTQTPTTGYADQIAQLGGTLGANPAAATADIRNREQPVVGEAEMNWQDSTPQYDPSKITRDMMRQYRRYTGARNMNSDMDRWKTWQAMQGNRNASNADYFAQMGRR